MFFFKYSIKKCLKDETNFTAFVVSKHLISDIIFQVSGTGKDSPDVFDGQASVCPDLVL